MSEFTCGIRITCAMSAPNGRMCGYHVCANPEHREGIDGDVHEAMAIHRSEVHGIEIRSGESEG